MATPNEDLITACREELDCLWHDLDKAIRRAIDGRWSIECDGLQGRIERLTKLVGPTPWEAIQIPLLESGVYQRIHEGIGVVAEVDMVRVAETRARIDERHARAMHRG